MFGNYALFVKNIIIEYLYRRHLKPKRHERFRLAPYLRIFAYHGGCGRQILSIAVPELFGALGLILCSKTKSSQKFYRENRRKSYVHM
jgi:hypothetical protein